MPNGEADLEPPAWKSMLESSRFHEGVPDHRVEVARKECRIWTMISHL